MIAKVAAVLTVDLAISVESKPCLICLRALAGARDYPRAEVCTRIRLWRPMNAWRANLSTDGALMLLMPLMAATPYKRIPPIDGGRCPIQIAPRL